MKILSKFLDKHFQYALRVNTISNYVVHENVVDGSSMIRFPLVIADPERDMPGIEHVPLGWHNSTLTTELQEVRQVII